MDNQEPKVYHYTKSLLLFWHILLGGAFLFASISFMTGYTQDVMRGRVVSSIILLSFFYLLYVSAKLFNQQRRGAAYALTISSFLVGVFLQMMSCVNSVIIH